MHVLARARWQFLKLTAEAQAEAACLVVPPQRLDTASKVHPAAVILFLTGAGHVDDREDFFVGGVDLLMRNDQAYKNATSSHRNPPAAAGYCVGKIIAGPEGSPREGLATYCKS